ncbi:hypothetical protein [Desulfosarcina ovata]|uniref:Uncharacterized protein n=1 Tax=Desulfosarcina ovata subsp. ovata TaxID=2752305 RepID=A0A5K8A974_9BACT|nr:hypothetical protein [Desulfosarcina ovata]BBO89026.1 hypothetical protein DSCOOX_22060 [Desulfosarcina ovata subsp. ovata]
MTARKEIKLHAIALLQRTAFEKALANGRARGTPVIRPMAEPELLVPAKAPFRTCIYSVRKTWSFGPGQRLIALP